MMIAKATGADGKTILILGLTIGNIQEMFNEKPIHITNDKHQNELPPNWEIVMFAGKDEISILAMFKQHGLIQPDTEVHVDPRLV